MGQNHREFPPSVLLYIGTAKGLQFSLMPTRGLKEYRQETIKIIFNFPDDANIFLLRDINCHTSIQLILKLYEKASSSKIDFSKVQVL